MRSLHRLWLLSGLFCLAACEDGTSTGNPNTDNGHGGDGTGELAGGGANCKVTSAMEVAPDAETTLGFKASDILAFVAGKHEEKITWNAQDGFTYGPESGEHTLTLEITAKGAPRLTHYTRAANGGGEIALIGGEACSDAIEIDVEVHVKTDQGALDETFSSTLVARNDKQVSLYQRLTNDKPEGSFSVSSVSLANARVVQLALSIKLTKYGTQGSFTGILEQRIGDGVAAGTSRDPIASWGPQDCGYHGTPVPNSAKVEGYSADDVLSLLGRATSASVASTGSAPSTASLAFSAQSDHACAVLDDGFATLGGEGSLYVRAALLIKSADGRIDATWPLGITATSTPSGEIQEVRVAFDDAQISATSDFGARYGLRDVDVSRFDSAIANLSLSATTQAPLSGTLTVTGFKNAPCAPSVMVGPDGSSSSGGCAGAAATQVAELHITASAGQ
jgi:hypothetical protein